MKLKFSAALCAVLVTGGLVSITPTQAVASVPAFEIVVLQKSSSQIQFGICINLPQSTYSGKNLMAEYRLKEGARSFSGSEGPWSFNGEILNAYNETYIPPMDLAVSTTGLVFRYSPPMNPSVTLLSATPCPYWAGITSVVANSGGGGGNGTFRLADGTVTSGGVSLTAGTTYTLEASIFMHSGDPSNGVTYRSSLVTTTDSGCPITEPQESTSSSYALMARLDSSSRVVEVKERSEAEGASGNWVATFANRKGKQLATPGLYYDVSQQNFGPVIETASNVSPDALFQAARLDRSTCASKPVDFEVTVPTTATNCRADANAIVVLQEGPCPFKLKANPRIGSSSANGAQNVLTSFARLFAFSDSPTLEREGVLYLKPLSPSAGGGTPVGGGFGGFPALPTPSPVNDNLKNGLGFGNISIEKVRTLTPEDIRAIPASQFSLLKTSQIRALVASQIREISGSQMKKIKPSVLKNIPARTLRSFSLAALKALSAKQSASLTTKQLNSLPKKKRLATGR